MTISLFRSVAGQYQDLRGLNTVSMMNMISHQIEDQIIGHSMPVDFYAGFQRFSYFPAQLRRYGQLGATCRRVFVFGIADVKPPRIPGVEFIDIAPSSPLAREWFLLVDTPQFWTTLLTQEIEGRDVLSGGRQFDGIWSYDERVVERVSLLISQINGGIYQPLHNRNYEQQSRHIAEINARMIGMLERSKLTSGRRWIRLCTMQKCAELLASQQQPTLILHEVARLLHMIFKAPSVVIAMHNGGDSFSTIAAEGEGSSGTTVRAGEGPSGRATEGSLVRVDDMRKNRERDVLIPGAQSLLAVPICGRRGILGVITLGSNETSQWDEEDAAAVTAMAALLASMVEQRITTDSGIGTQSDHARTLGQAVLKLRGPLNRLQDLHHELRQEGPYTDAQLSLLGQTETLTAVLAQIVGGSKLPPPFDIAMRHQPQFDLAL